MKTYKNTQLETVDTFELLCITIDDKETVLDRGPECYDGTHMGKLYTALAGTARNTGLYD